MTNTISKAMLQLVDVDSYFTGFVLRAAKSGRAGMESIVVIAEQICRCQRCALARSRTTPVPGEGDPHAEVMLVGEAPGMEEDLQGRPFVGKAGQLLDRILQACGLARAGLFITNVLKCRPPNNRQPRPDEIVACLPYLHGQIRLIRPRLIIALGAHAARALLDTNKPITALRGVVHACRIPGYPATIDVVATYHPAHLLRNYTYENRKAVWQDMKLALRQLGLDVPSGGP